MSRIGIDLSASRSHLIEVRAAAARATLRSASASSTNVQETRVLSFETIPYGWAEPDYLVSKSGIRRRAISWTPSAIPIPHPVHLSEPADGPARHSGREDCESERWLHRIAGDDGDTWQRPVEPELWF